MIKIRKKRLENLMGNRFFAPIKQQLRNLANRSREKKLRDIFAGMQGGKTPFFHQIQVETCSFCNNDCHFCPASTAVDPRPREFMSWDVIDTLINQLRDIQFNGMVSLFNNNDPLIDKRLPEIIARFREGLPDAKIEIYTNGILLNLEVAEKLWEAGLDSLMIDHYYTKSARNRKIEQFIEDFKKSEHYQRRNVTINEINKEIIRSSRGGEAPNRKQAKAEAFCVYPFMQFNVNYLGEVHICCNDVYYKQVFGNITEQHITEIWNSPRYQLARKNLLNENRNFGVCTDCDTRNLLKGADKIVHQHDNNQVVIPGYINNDETVKHKEPASVYPIG